MARHCRESLPDDGIMQDLHVDQLSDVPSDCESDKNSNDDDDDDFGSSTSQKSRKGARLGVSDSFVNIDDDDELFNDGKNDDLRNLEQFLGNTDHTFTSNDPTSTSEVVNSFLGNDFLKIVVEQSNLYHAQNADKYQTPQSI
jgi:hypothetical protein